MCQIVNPEEIQLSRFAEADSVEKRKAIVSRCLEDVGIQHQLKVLISTNSLGCGGQEHQVMMLIPELKKLGLEVEHMYYSPPHILEEKYRDRNIKSVFIDKNKLGRFKCWKKQIHYIKSNNFDVVHAFGGTANIYVRGAAVFAGTKLILATSRDRTGPKGLPCVLLNSLLNLFTPTWVINSRTNAEGLEKLKFIKNKHLYILPNALDLYDNDSLHSLQMDVDLEKWIEKRHILATAGRICRVKNYDLFLDFAKQVHRHFPDSCFLIIGGPDCRAEGPIFQEKISNRIKNENLDSFVKMTGWIENMVTLYPNIDLFVSTSDFEGCPNVVLEAMRAAKPVVMTNSCDTSCLIKEGKNGFVVPVGNVDKLVEKIMFLLNSKQTRLDFGKVSRQIVENNFSTPKAAWLLTKIYINELSIR